MKFAAIALPTAGAHPSDALSTTGSSSGSASKSKFVIARLAATVTTLNAELAAKTAENGAFLRETSFASSTDAPSQLTSCSASSVVEKSSSRRRRRRIPRSSSSTPPA